MTNKRGLRSASTTQARKNPAISDAARAGWADAVAGRGFSREYEAQSRVWQLNYETARGAVAFARAARMALPRWPAGVKLPQAVLGIVEASQRAGAVLPPVGRRA